MTVGVDALLRAALRDWRAASRDALRGNARRGDVHAWRIATRRLLALADAGLEPAASRRIERELRRAFRASGKLRDAQVGIDLARAMAPADPCALGLASWLRHRVPRWRRRLLVRLAEVERRRVSRIVERDLPTSRPDIEARGALAFERCDAALRKVRTRRARLTLASPPSDSHRLRVAVKRARYLSEAVARLPRGVRYAATARALARQQRALGEVADLAVLQDRLAQFARRHPGDAGEAQVFGRALRRRQVASFRQALRSFPADPVAAHRRKSGT
ncbi:MAG: CHAD domain-containing protein [Steroidobacteraceae bacterium]|nr:CHAD domain-containing protein [Steroidobacteraceae bacterium]